jgi:hypothetical protein
MFIDFLQMLSSCWLLSLRYFILINHHFDQLVIRLRMNWIFDLHHLMSYGISSECKRKDMVVLTSMCLVLFHQNLQILYLLSIQILSYQEFRNQRSICNTSKGMMHSCLWKVFPWLPYGICTLAPGSCQSFLESYCNVYYSR